MSITSYKWLAYLGLIPFLVFTYQSWCGPIEGVQAATQAFLIFSSSALIFISGCWGGLAFRQSESAKLPMLLTGILFGLGTAIVIYAFETSWIVISLGLGHLLIWILEFFIPESSLEHSYKIQRTILTMTILVCHVLVSTQFI